MVHSSGYRIISQQYDTLSYASACVPAREERQWTLRLRPFTKLFQIVCCVCLTIQTQFISCSSRGGLGFISIFSFLFLCAGHSAGLGRGESRCSSILREGDKGHCLWRRTKTFGIYVTQPSFNTQFGDLAGSTVYRKLSCLIQQPEWWLGVQGQASNTGMLNSIKWSFII